MPAARRRKSLSTFHRSPTSGLPTVGLAEAVGKGTGMEMEMEAEMEMEMDGWKELIKP